MNWKNRVYCQQVSLNHIGQHIQIFGWIDTVRDHGQLLFAHIRDVSGIVQVVFDPAVQADAYQTAQTLRSEYVVGIAGIVAERSDETKNSQIVTGQIEIQVESVTVFNSALTPPFQVTDKDLAEAGQPFMVDEDLRMTYRYLDLRRVDMQRNLIHRSQILKLVRDYLDQARFIEVETPLLTKSTPEGARDYLVPSRLHEQHFYALPQSPQLFKQLLMISGFDRYYQVARCFRDEDLRPNRQPEFTQLDMEASFIDESFIYTLIEGLIRQIFAFEGRQLTGDFETIRYDDAINLYGTDAPDLRFGLTFCDVTSIFANTSYQIFQRVIQSGGVIKGFNIQGKADVLTKNLLQNEWALKLIPQMGGKGMTWMKVQDGQLQSNIVQFFSTDEQARLISEMNASDGDVLIFVADKPAIVNDLLSRFRLYVADYLQLIPANLFRACWVVDFPMFEKKNGRIESVHHPFTQAASDILAVHDEAGFLSMKARAYDLVINGVEIGGGSIRNHSPAVQERIFEILGLSKADIQEKFGFFVQAFQYGAPPHGGIALGMDRLLSMILGTTSIRDVIAFPKNRMAFCPLTGAPSAVEDGQLSDLHLTYFKNLK